MAEFIFMLTRHDRTVPDAMAHLDDAFAAGIAHVGVKDVGLPFDELAIVADAVRRAGRTLYVEVVSLDEASEIASAEAALRLRANVLMGGTRPHCVLPMLRGSGLRYYPFCGHISGHPSVLEGSCEEIVASARAIAALEGVHGLDLLAYRSGSDAAALIAAVCGAVGKPVVVAGSLDRPERITVAVAGGAAGFTVGTAALDGVFPTGPALRDQLAFIAAMAQGSAAG